MNYRPATAIPSVFTFLSESWKGSFSIYVVIVAHLSKNLIVRFIFAGMSNGNCYVDLV